MINETCHQCGENMNSLVHFCNAGMTIQYPDCPSDNLGCPDTPQTLADVAREKEQEQFDAWVEKAYFALIPAYFADETVSLEGLFDEALRAAEVFRNLMRDTEYRRDLSQK